MSNGSRVGKVIGLIFGAGFAAVWIGGWSAGTIFFDLTFARDTLRQVRSAGYPTVVGHVVESRVNVSSDGESTSHNPVVRYAYRVNNRQYLCDRYRYGAKSAVRKDAQRVLSSHPAGSAVTVHYRPDDPSDAVLQAGIGGGDLFMPLFLTPFNLVMLASWALAARWIGRLFGPREAGGVRVVYRDTTLCVRLPEKPPLRAAAITLGALTFAAVFVLGFTTGVDADMRFTEATWAVILAATGAVYVRLAMPVWAGRTDLLIEPFPRRLTLPATFGRDEPVSVRFQDVESVRVAEKVTKSDESTTRHYFPTVCYRDDRGERQSARLAKWVDRERAEGFAVWLRGRVGT